MAAGLGRCNDRPRRNSWCHSDLTELHRLAATYRTGRQPELVVGRLVIVVGDGLTCLAVMPVAASTTYRRGRQIGRPGDADPHCRRIGGPRALGSRFFSAFPRLPGALW